MEEEGKKSDSVMDRLVHRWESTRDHIVAYPYVWASYLLVFGGLGIITMYRVRALRKAEDDLLRFEEKLRKRMTAKEIEEATRESNQDVPFGKQ